MNVIALAFSALLFSLQSAAQDPETDRLKKEVERLKADNAVVMRQLEVTLAQIKELNDKIAKSQDPKTPAQALTKESAARALAALPPVPRAPSVYSTPDHLYQTFKAKVEGKVTAIANEIGLIVLSVGSEHGVKVGDEFTIYRGGDFVAKVVVDRVDLKWSAAKVVLKKLELQVADEVTNVAVVSAPKPVAPVQVPLPAPSTVPLSRTTAGELNSLRKELDEVRAQVRQLSDRLVPSWQGAGVSVDETPEELRAHLGILRGLLVRRLREGSPAEKAGLKANDVIPDLLEAQLLEAIESGMPIHVVRQGQRMRLPGAKGK